MESQRRAAWALVAMLGVTPTGASSQEIRFSKPIDCALDETCFVQNYVDHDLGQGARDFACGPRTYDHHTGTDIRIRDLMAMHEGVDVLAAADGRVAHAREGMADVSFRQIDHDAIKGRSCGNGVVIDHDDGWRTIYCHIRKGSISVSRGEAVKRGQKLGLVGISGRTEFPHLHFEVRHRRRVVDPFVGPAMIGACGGREQPLWRSPAADKLVYVPAAVIGTGFTDNRPSGRTLEAGEHRKPTLPRAAPAIIFWVRMVGLRPGDQQDLLIFRPDGSVLAHSRLKDVDRPNALYWGYVGKPRRSEEWRPGTYRGQYRMVRDGRLLVQKSATVRVE